MFLRNLLLSEKNELHNREMHVSGKFLLGHDDPINDPINLSEREVKILDLIKEKSNLTRKDMAERLGCSEPTVKRSLQKMGDRGVIKRIGSNKKGEWIVI